MSANRIQIKASVGDKKITLPFGQMFDELGREQLLEMYDEAELQDNINYIQDYETTRYAPNYPPEFRIFYEFQFYDDATNSYIDDFKTLGYTNAELASDESSFTKSFFKFDFYDVPIREEQKMMFSMVMPANNCSKKGVAVDPAEDPEYYWAQIAEGISNPVYNIYFPAFSGAAAPTGAQENYYLHWLKDRDLFTASTFYVTCKFFNAKNGEVIRMLNKIPSPLQGAYSFEDWFYFQVNLNIETGNTNPKYNYTINTYTSILGNLGITGSEVGETFNGPIRFFEYRTG